MQRNPTKSSPWIALILVSGIPRILGAFLLPNAFGDAYAYIKDIGLMSAKISSRTFALSDLYGFWLPLYQLICAVINVFVNRPFYVAKLVSAIFGSGVCLLVYAICLRLTAHRTAALLAFALIALNPLHIFNSASAMTDLPSAFFVLGSLYFVLKKRWIVAAVFAALAGLTRVDNWMLIVLLLFLQLLEERRVSLPSLAILIFPPLFWFYISWHATGDWLACFVMRKQYMDALYAANPSLARFSLFGIARDGGALIFSTDIAVLIACFVAGWIVIRQIARPAKERRPENLRRVLTVSVFFFAFFAFIVLAYITHTQPIIFPRYGLINFALGIPILPWAYLRITRGKPHWKHRLLVSIVAVCVFEAGVQVVGSAGFINKQHTLGTVGEYLRLHFHPTPGSHIFSDDGTVLAFSGLP